MKNIAKIGVENTVKQKMYERKMLKFFTCIEKTQQDLEASQWSPTFYSWEWVLDASFEPAIPCERKRILSLHCVDQHRNHWTCDGHGDPLTIGKWIADQQQFEQSWGRFEGEGLLSMIYVTKAYGIQPWFQDRQNFRRRRLLIDWLIYELIASVLTKQ